MNPTRNIKLVVKTQNGTLECTLCPRCVAQVALHIAQRAPSAQACDYCGK